MQTSQLLIGVAVATLAALTLAAFGGRVIAQTTLPEGPNRDLVAGICGSCHDIEMVVINGRSEERWRVTIEEMTGYGLRLAPADQALILEYLKTYLPPK